MLALVLGQFRRQFRLILNEVGSVVWVNSSIDVSRRVNGTFVVLVLVLVYRRSKTS